MKNLFWQLKSSTQKQQQKLQHGTYPQCSNVARYSKLLMKWKVTSSTFHILGISEMRWTGNSRTTSEGTTILFSGN